MEITNWFFIPNTESIKADCLSSNELKGKKIKEEFTIRIIRQYSFLYQLSPCFIPEAIPDKAGAIPEGSGSEVCDPSSVGLQETEVQHLLNVNHPDFNPPEVTELVYAITEGLNKTSQKVLLKARFEVF